MNWNASLSISMDWNEQYGQRLRYWYMNSWILTRIEQWIESEMGIWFQHFDESRDDTKREGCRLVL